MPATPKTHLLDSTCSQFMQLYRMHPNIEYLNALNWNYPFHCHDK